MEEFDREMAQRVWQRVREGAPASLSPEAEEDALPTLIRQRLMAAAEYRQLARKRGQEASAIAALAAAAQSQGMCLQGLHRVLTGTSPKIAVPKIPGTVTPVQCIRRELQWIAECDSQSRGVWGWLFSQFADQSRYNITTLLEILGRTITGARS